MKDQLTGSPELPALVLRLQVQSVPGCSALVQLVQVLVQAMLERPRLALAQQALLEQVWRLEPARQVLLGWS